MAESNHSESAIDLNEIASKLISDNLDKITAAVRKMGSKVSQEIRYQLSDVYREYLLAGIARYQKTKTLLYRNEPVPLYEFYVPLDLKNKERTIKSAGIRQIRKVGKQVIVSGIAGTGKSTFLKHLFLDSIVTGLTIPIFIELRLLNDSKLDLMELIVRTIQLQKVRLGTEYIERAFAAGEFTLLLDAYDEVNSEVRESVRKGIFRLCEDYPETHVVVSSRPDEEFIGWTQFTEYQAMKLSKQQAILLASKLRYDDEVKQRFVTELGRKLYTQHESFLSNPLLLTIMLITYHENADIPSKKHIFYSQVFETLFNRHDATKEGYRRQTATRMAMDDFQRVLASFAAQTYLDTRISLGKDLALRYLQKAKAMTGLDFSVEDFLTDLLKSVCLMVQDGLFFTYTHKQFQEYYTAVFISGCELGAQRRFVGKITPDFEPTEVIRILYEMNPQLVERLFTLPAIKQILKSIAYSGEITDASFARFWHLQVRSIKLDGDEVVFDVTAASLLNFMRFLQWAYFGVVSLKTAPNPATNHKLLSDAMKQCAGSERSYTCEFSKLAEHPSILKILKSFHVLNLDQFRYLIDVRDFIEHRQGKRSSSIDDILGGKRKPTASKRVKR